MCICKILHSDFTHAHIWIVKFQAWCQHCILTNITVDVKVKSYSSPVISSVVMFQSKFFSRASLFSRKCILQYKMTSGQNQSRNKNNQANEKKHRRCQTLPQVPQQKTRFTFLISKTRGQKQTGKTCKLTKLCEGGSLQPGCCESGSHSENG